MLEVFQIFSLLTSFMLFFAVVLKNGLERYMKDCFPVLVGRIAQICIRISAFSVKIANTSILIFGVLVLPREIYAAWMIICMLMVVVAMKARLQKVQWIEEVRFTKHLWLDYILTLPFYIVFFLGSVTLFPIIVFNL